MAALSSSISATHPNFCIAYRLAECSFHSIIQVVHKGIAQHWPQYQSLTHSTSDQLPAGFCTTDHLVVQPDFHHLIVCPLTQSLSHQCCCKDVMGDCAKGLAQVKE